MGSVSGTVFCGYWVWGVVVFFFFCLFFCFGLVFGLVDGGGCGVCGVGVGGWLGFCVGGRPPP
ncbi:hypothetical protein PUR61_00950, partial [Streptomyces sp. BE20]|uniref:hypothetical protein n=1 Tax=Streptomyces sp. BE20 TaxID=3002525 RepID=UPI002E76DD7C